MIKAIFLLTIFFIQIDNLRAQLNGFSVQRADGSQFFIQKIYHQIDGNSDCDSGNFVGFQRCEVVDREYKNCEYYNHLAAKETITTPGFFGSSIGGSSYTRYRSETPAFYCTSKFKSSEFLRWIDSRHDHLKSVGKTLQWSTFVVDIGLSMIILGPIGYGVKRAVLNNAAKRGSAWVFKRFAGKKALRAGSIAVGGANFGEGFIIDLEKVIKWFGLKIGYQIAEYQTAAGSFIFNEDFTSIDYTNDNAMQDYSDKFFEKEIDSDFSDLVKTAPLQKYDADKKKVTSMELWSQVDIKKEELKPNFIEAKYYY